MHMKRTIRILQRLPGIYHTVREFQQIARTEDDEFAQWQENNQKDLDDSFIKTAGEESISIWENEIGIRPDVINESIDFRRQRLINRYTIKPPFTMHWLEQQLKQLLGDGFIKLIRDQALLNLTVQADLVYLPLLREFDVTLEAILPMTMQYFKQLNAHRIAQTNAYMAATNIVHIHLDITTA